MKLTVFTESKTQPKRILRISGSETKRKVQEMKKLIHKFDIKINDLGLQV